ncbi:MAG: tetratricopeptide repeat protein [Candidatus Solibacter sp.]|nr:tetratricopeptide repeat protein [Candidatus Solibacter sp.]
MIVLAAVALWLAQASVPRAAPPELAEAAAQMERGNLARAAGILESLTAANPASPADAYGMLAQSWAQFGQPQRAMDAAERGLKAHPQSALLRKTLGLMLFRTAPQGTRAGELLGAASRALPSDPEVHHFYAQWAFLNHREEVCVAESRKVAALSQHNDLALLQSYTLAALAEQKLDHPAQAEAAFRKALEVNRRMPGFDPAAAFQFIDFLGKAGRPEDARKIVDEVLRLQPGYGPAHLEKAKFLDVEQLYQGAVDEAEAALKLQGCDPAQIRAAHVLLARTYFLLGNSEAAQVHQAWVEAH